MPEGRAGLSSRPSGFLHWHHQGNQGPSRKPSAHRLPLKADALIQVTWATYRALPECSVLTDTFSSNPMATPKGWLSCPLEGELQLSVEE